MYAVPAGKLLSVYGLDVAIPRLVGVGGAEPKGTTNISHAVAVPASVQPKTAEVCVTTAVSNTGLGHVGSGSQVTLATQPGLLTDPSLIKLNVKHPSGLEDSNGPGIVLPQKEPGNDPPIKVGPFPLEI